MMNCLVSFASYDDGICMNSLDLFLTVLFFFHNYVEH